MFFPKNQSIQFLLAAALLGCACTPREKVVEAPETIVKETHFVMPALPDSVQFCGEIIPIDDFDRIERLDREVLVNAYNQSTTIISLKRANRYFPAIEAELKKHGIPEDFKYLCLIESGLAQATSPAGAKGFWQFMPGTADEFGLRIDREVDERLHIAKSTAAACQYLKDAYEKFGDWTLVAASYNMGMGGVSEALEDQEVDDYFDLHLNNETSRYVFRILAMKLIFENAEAYGFRKEEFEKYGKVKTRKIALTESNHDLMHWAREQGSTFRMLKLLNPWVLGNGLTVKNEPLYLELPE